MINKLWHNKISLSLLKTAVMFQCFKQERLANNERVKIQTKREILWEWETVREGDKKRKWEKWTITVRLSQTPAERESCCVSGSSTFAVLAKGQLGEMERLSPSTQSQIEPKHQPGASREWWGITSPMWKGPPLDQCCKDGGDRRLAWSSRMLARLRRKRR